MKKLLLLLLVLVACRATAQSPAKFSYQVKKLDGLHYEVTITISINSPWHIYSQDAPPPVLRTTIQFAKNPLVEIKTKPVEKGNLVTKHDDVFDADLKYYDNKVAYVQKVTLKTAVKTILTGSVQYMLCTNEQCIKPNPEQFKLVFE